MAWWRCQKMQIVTMRRSLVYSLGHLICRTSGWSATSISSSQPHSCLGRGSNFAIEGLQGFTASGVVRLQAFISEGVVF